MNTTEPNQHAQRSAAAAWLSEETAALARDAGCAESDAEALAKIVRKLAETVCGNRETHLRLVPAREDFAFLEKAAAEPPLNRIAGTPASYAAGALTPLIFDAGNAALYFFRHYRQECETAEKISALAALPPASVSEKMREIIEADAPFPLSEEQKRAVRAVASAPLAVVSGGPGTGKTTLLLRALLCIFSENPDAEIILAAPTGKAASRMSESVRKQADEILRRAEAGESFPFPRRALRKTCALEARTLHRALADARGVPALEADCVVVDEASMIDQPLMHRLMRALPPRARLVLLGDKNQLDSVGPGHVFGAICAEEKLSGAKTELTESRRFSETGTLGRLAGAVVRGDARATAEILDATAGTAESVFRLSEEKITPERLDAALLELFPEKLRRVSADADPRETLELFESVRMLTPLRGGETGADALNARARRLFSPPGSDAAEHFHGQPIIIARNARQEQLFNGDLGVVLRERRTGTLVAHFRGGNGEIRAIPVGLLPEHESAYAMSIHKAQGSEFSRLAVLFPPASDAGTHTDFFSRQLLYTAITRFREGGNAPLFLLLFDRENLLEAVRRESASNSLLFAHAAQTPNSLR